MLKIFFLTNLQGFDLHIAGVYCKPCLQPISCLSCLAFGSFGVQFLGLGKFLSIIQ